MISPYLISLHAQKYRVEKYSVDQGLPYSYVSSIHQDKRGFMWFGTFDGLACFDGYKFKVFRNNTADSSTIASNNVHFISEDRSANIWVSTSKGTQRLNRITNKFETVWTKESNISKHLFRGIPVERFDGKDYLVSEKHIYEINPSTLEAKKILSFPDRILAYHQDENKKEWVVTNQSIYRILTKEEFELDQEYRKDKIQFSESNSEIIKLSEKKNSQTVVVEKYSYPDGLSTEDIAFDQDHNMWGVIPGRGLVKFITSLNSFSIITNPGLRELTLQCNHLFIPEPSSINSFTQPTLWLGTKIGAFEYLPDGTQIRKVTAENNTSFGLSSMYISRIYQDKSGILWCAIDGFGIEKVVFSTSHFNHFQNTTLTSTRKRTNPIDVPISSNFVMSLTVDRDTSLWVGSLLDGLSYVKKYLHNSSASTSVKFDPQIKSIKTVHCIKQLQNGEVWVGSNSGLFTLEKNNDLIRVKEKLKYNSVTHLIECLPQNFVIIGQEYRGVHAINIETKKEIWSIATGSIRAMALENDTTLWLGTYEGCYVYDLKTMKSIKYSHDPRNPQSISTNLVNMIFKDSNNQIWIATSEGLNHFDRETKTFGRFSTKDGLPNNFIYAIVEDGRKNLWLSTNYGISNFNPRLGTFKNYDQSDGLQGNEFNTGAYYQSASGEIFFGGTNGITSFFPDSLLDNPVPPKIAFTDFKKFDRSIELDSAIGEKQDIVLNFDESVFSIEFAALEFTNTAQNRYAYKMDGVDRDWVYSGVNREVRYTNLAPGTYSFHVRACNNSGVWNTNGKTLRIRIMPPFWRMWWFILSTALFFIGSVVSISYLYSQRKIKEYIRQIENQRNIEFAQNKTREKIARDLHDDVGSTIGSIGLYTESLKHSLAQLEAAIDSSNEFHEIGAITEVEDSLKTSINKLINKIEGLLRDAEIAIDDIVWEVAPKNDHFSDLISRLQRFGNDIIETKKIELKFDFSSINPNLSLEDTFRRNIYLILKELLNNSVKYGEPTKIEIVGEFASNILFIHYLENGNGFNLESKPQGGGNGLFNMNARAKEIGATFELNTAPTKGVEAKLKVPFG
ncbi:MAG: two-component regulator propeller domain-containing protein [Chloroherpetonaceae bacterium]|nr:two-component regulator propeller domain-containing protein [Chloroherpetonaceae bacterium]